MRYDVVLAPEAVEDLKSLRAYLRKEIKDGIEKHLQSQPTRQTKSRIKRLRGLSQPQYRLRVGAVRVFYDVVGQEVQVLAIVDKEHAQSWLEMAGKKS
jgi:mRNA interferase RelE/StbE